MTSTGTAPDKPELHSETKSMPADTFAETLKQLRKPVDPKLVKQREGWRDRDGVPQMVDYVEWHTVADILDDVAPGWQHHVKEIREINDILTMTVALTIDGITREGVGCGNAHNEMGIKKAEHDALKRAAVKFGVARELYKTESHEIEILGDTASNGNDPFPSQPVAKHLGQLITAKQLGMVRALARELRIDADEECNATMNCRSDELSKTAASAFIKHLQVMQRPPEVPRKNNVEDLPLHQSPVSLDEEENQKAEAWRAVIDTSLKSVGIAPEEWLARFDTNCKTLADKESAYRAVLKKVRETKIKLIRQSWDDQGWSANDRLTEQQKLGIKGNLESAADLELDKLYESYIAARQIITK